MKLDVDRIIILIGFILVFVIIIIFKIPFIDEFPTDGFACITQPCIMPKITIIDWITRLF
jgi:hypothetical protein